MDDTYNENEIVKLKHLNEFARQLNVKLDGETDPLPKRSPTIRLGFRGSTLIWDGESTLRVPASKMYARTDDVAFGPSLIIPHELTTSPTILPNISIEDFTGNNEWVNWIYTVLEYPGSTSWQLTLNVKYRQSCSYKVKINIIKGDGFDAYTTTIPIEIYDDTN